MPCRHAKRLRYRHIVAASLKSCTGQEHRPRVPAVDADVDRRRTVALCHFFRVNDGLFVVATQAWSEGGGSDAGIVSNMGEKTTARTCSAGNGRSYARFAQSEAGEAPGAGGNCCWASDHLAVTRLWKSTYHHRPNRCLRCAGKGASSHSCWQHRACHAGAAAASRAKSSPAGSCAARV